MRLGIEELRWRDLCDHISPSGLGPKGPRREHLVRALARLKIKVYQPSPYLRVYGLIKPRLSFYSKTSFTVLWALPIESI
jgi:hypothetical protein